MASKCAFHELPSLHKTRCNRSVRSLHSTPRDHLPFVRILSPSSRAMESAKDQENDHAGQGDPSTNALQIFCRLRPPEAIATEDLTEEDGTGKSNADTALHRKTDTALVVRRPNSFLELQYHFEYVFDADAKQDAVFKRTALPMIDAFLAGQDGLMFAYGATGSGKSFTVGGQPDKPGIVPSTIDYLFGVLACSLNAEYHIAPDYQNGFIVNNRMSDGEDGLEETAADQSMHLGGPERAQHLQLVDDWSKRVCIEFPSLEPSTSKHITGRRYSVFVSFIEIYNNYIYDLLEQPDQSTVNWRRAPHQLRHDARKTVYVHGASEVQAKSADQAMRLFLYGLQNRQTAATILNQSSSRSHSVFTLKLVSYVEAEIKGGRQLLDANQLAVTHLSIVDLAGVERTSRTKATGAMLAEANNINNSLLTLRNCFETMRQNQTAKQPALIPYRTHKLTFLLKSFFESGQSLIRMIVCVKPSAEDIDENVQVLSFGKKAQEIVIERQLPSSGDIQVEFDREDQSSESSSFDQFEFTLTRFKANVDEQQLADGTFDFGRFTSEMEQYLQSHEEDSRAIVRGSQKILQQLSDTLKPYPEPQAYRRSLALDGYSPKLSGILASKLLPIYRTASYDHRSTCLHGLDSIAGTPIVMSHRKQAPKSVQVKQLAMQELTRELSIWESANIDILAKLGGQVNELSLYIDKVLNVPPNKSHSTAKMDVFTRLYKQTPARYKVNAKNAKANSTLPVSTNKVSQLKKLFTPSELSKAVPGRSGRKHLVMSSKIKSLCSQLTAQDPDLVTKLMPSSATGDKRSCSAAKTNRGEGGGGKAPQVKRQLFH